jgi:hypothetical protein
MKFHILSLDGGDVWSLIQVRALIELYDRRRAATQFCGISTLSPRTRVAVWSLPAWSKI